MSNRLKIKPKPRDKAWAMYQRLLKGIEDKKQEEIDAGKTREELEGEHFNCYVCKSCKAVKRVKIVDYGTTPFMGVCEKCGSDSTSTFFKDVAPEKPFTEEWYRPGFEEFFSIYKKNDRGRDAYLNHILSGGLLSRPIKS